MATWWVDCPTTEAAMQETLRDLVRLVRRRRAVPGAWPSSILRKSWASFSNHATVGAGTPTAVQVRVI